MKNFICNLKGTKKNKTENIEVLIKADTPGQAFKIAWFFFERGEIDMKIGGPALPNKNFKDFIVGAKSLEHLAGKYFVPRKSINPLFKK